LFEIKTVILENQPAAYLPFLFFSLLPLWPIWNFFPSLTVLVIIFGLILHTLHWLQDFVRRRARRGHSRSLKGIIQMWSNEPQCFKAILCQEIAFQQIFSHAFQKHPVNKIIKNIEKRRK